MFGRVFDNARENIFQTKPNFTLSRNKITLKLVSFKGKAAIYHQNTASYLKVRLVVRVPNFPTRRLRHFLDTFLKPCLKHIVNYVHESADFLITKVEL